MPETETYELKDKSTTFFDPETKFKITADQQVEIDAKKRKGKLTLAAINAGGLIAVDAKAAKGEKSAEGKSDAGSKASSKGRGAAKDKEK